MAAKKKSNKKVTHSEFISWLEGVESMQEENWTPNAAQWKTIREKLDTIKPDVQIKETEVVRQAAPQAMAPGGEQPFSFAGGGSTFDQRPPAQPQRLAPPRGEVTPSAHEGVPAANKGPFLNPDGTLPAESEFL